MRANSVPLIADPFATVIPAGLEAVPQFVLWKLKQIAGRDKPSKVPCRYDGELINHLEPSNWLDASTAEYLARQYGLGVAFVFTPNDPYFGIDVDNCFDPATGEWSPHALKLYYMFERAAFEFSQSGKGMHLIGMGAPALLAIAEGDPERLKKRLSSAGEYNFEIYTHGRFFALTGKSRQGSAAVDFSNVMPAFVNAYGILRPVAPPPPPPSPITMADADVLAKALMSSGSAAAMFGAKAKFKDLFEGRESALAAHWPVKGRADGLSYDASSADLALCNHLAFWCSRDEGQMERLFMASKLGEREKVHSRRGYLSKTISKACRDVTVTYNKDYHRLERRLNADSERAAIGADVGPDPTPPIMSAEQMVAELIYVAATQDIVTRAGKSIYSYDAARKVYKSSLHHWNDENGKTKSRPAFDAWMDDKRRVTADVMTWDPGEDLFCEPIDGRNGMTTAVNLWRGIRPMLPPDDWQERAKIFTDHVRYLVPLEGQFERFMCWLAHIVQRPHELPHTAWLHITDTTGIGRNTMADYLVRVLRGYVACGVALGGILDNDFNGVLSQKLLAVVDEVREGMGDKKYARGETLKRIVTESHRMINGKYERQVTEVNCCRWLMFSNHEDAVPFESNDRRIEVVANPTVAMSEDYYARLRAGRDDPLTIAAVFHQLSTWDLRDFNPGRHAEMSDAKIAALDSMTTEVEKAVRDFRDNWPGYWCLRNANLMEFIKRQSPGVEVKDYFLNKLIGRTKMINSGHRVGNGYSFRDRIIIVRGMAEGYTAEWIKAQPNDALINHATEWNRQFRANHG